MHEELQTKLKQIHQSNCELEETLFKICEGPDRPGLPKAPGVLGLTGELGQEGALGKGITRVKGVQVRESNKSCIIDVSQQALWEMQQLHEKKSGCLTHQSNETRRS